MQPLVKQIIPSIPARELLPGIIIRLDDHRFEAVRSVAFEESQLVVGGPENKTATALRVTTDKGTSFLVHPGKMIGFMPRT